MATPISALLWRQLRTYQIYGANTDVGKTIFSVALCNAASKYYLKERVSYLKPVSTGAEDEADSCHIRAYSPSTANETLFQYGIPCSPHTAARLSGQPIPSDSTVLSAINDHARRAAALGPGWLFIETAGGVHSPGPSGTPQADLYSPLRAPILLVGDAKLGGISQTIAAYESLKLRGQDVEAVLLLHNSRYENHLYLRDYFSDRQGGIPVTTILPPPDPIIGNSQAERASMAAYYDSVLERSSSSEEGEKNSSLRDVLAKLDQDGQSRIRRLETMSESATKSIWYPFTQQKLLTADRIAAIDSAHGDFFQVVNKEKGNKTSSSSAAKGEEKAPSSVLIPAFDGSASWWTQGLGHGNPRLTLAAAYAAGRYGHVMFAEGVHEPALAVAETLLGSMGNERLSRVFYSDNGSTGCEVAVKMALRATRKRYHNDATPSSESKSQPNTEATPLGVLGFKGSYHGDTMGAMDCSEPSTYNEKVEWYKGKGHWLDYPTVKCSGGKWIVDDGKTEEQNQFSTLDDVLDLDTRIKSQAYSDYKSQLYQTLEELKAQGKRFGALVLEPMVLGAGGMLFVDPLFQRALIDTVRESPELFGGESSASSSSTNTKEWSGLPVVFDEVFVGLYRLGRFSAASFLGVDPDIVVNAKLLTGGLLPLCTTMSSESIFDAFASDDKSDALLHGHSYTAHAVGCQVALESLKELKGMDVEGGAWDWAKKGSSAITTTGASSSKPSSSWSMWSSDFVEQVSNMTDKVSGVWSLGSVLAVTMRSADGVSGYKSNAAAEIQAKLKEGRGDSTAWSAHTRVLGNVFYVMAGQKTEQDTVVAVQERILEALGGK